MDDSAEPSPADRIVSRLEADALAAARAELDAVGTAPVDARKAALRSLRTAAEDDPALVGPLCAPLATFLEDGDRAVRLSAAKLLAAVAAGSADAAVPVVGMLADRLADDGEFYYVRARCAEALGYVALNAPAAVADPELIAELRVGLAFDEPEVREKLAEALAGVALGDPGRLRHQVASLADHLDDDRDLVRYHLCTALVAVGCVHPGALVEARDPLAARLTDDAENPYVRGRAAEALGLLVRETDASVPAPAVEGDEGEATEFLTARLAWLRGGQQGTTDGTDADGVGTLAAVRSDAGAVAEAVATPDGETCPHCGLELPADAPPMCPRCGGPR